MYVEGRNQQSKIEIEEGIRKYPNNPKLSALSEQLKNLEDQQKEENQQKQEGEASRTGEKQRGGVQDIRPAPSDRSLELSRGFGSLPKRIDPLFERVARLREIRAQCPVTVPQDLGSGL